MDKTNIKQENIGEGDELNLSTIPTSECEEYVSEEDYPNYLNKGVRHIRVPNRSTFEGLDYRSMGVYAELKKYMNKDTHDCFPSLAKLAEDTGMTPKTVKKHLKLLEEKGHIIISKLDKTKKGFDFSDRKRTPNRYIFNEDSELFKNYERFSYKFLENPNLEFREKAACIALQQHMMNKESGFATISSSTLRLSDYLGCSYNTMNSIINNLKSAGVVTTVSENTKDLEVKEKETAYVFNFEVLGQAILYNQKKISEHDERLLKLEEENLNMKKTIELLSRQLNTIQVSELEKVKHLSVRVNHGEG